MINKMRFQIKNFTKIHNLREILLFLLKWISVPLILNDRIYKVNYNLLTFELMVHNHFGISTQYKFALLNRYLKYCGG